MLDTQFKSIYNIIQEHTVEISWNKTSNGKLYYNIAIIPVVAHNALKHHNIISFSVTKFTGKRRSGVSIAMFINDSAFEITQDQYHMLTMLLQELCKTIKQKELKPMEECDISSILG